MIKDSNPRAGRILRSCGVDPVRDWVLWQGVMLRLEWRRGLFTSAEYQELLRLLVGAPTLERWEQLYLAHTEGV